MKKSEPICSSHFFDLLDYLTVQFLNDKTALCTGESFGKNISPKARDYFSVAVISEELPGGMTMMGVLLNNSVYEKSKYGCTHTIFIDLPKIEGVLFKAFLSILLAHEVCHFASFYELFIEQEDKTGMVMHQDFINAVSGIPTGCAAKEQESGRQFILDNHSIADLIKVFGKYTKEHFTKRKDTNINYQQLFYDFIEHFNTSKILNECK